MADESYGQYGKRNPLFMYQGTAGYSIQAELNASAGEERAYTAEPPQSGLNRCGALQ